MLYPKYTSLHISTQNKKCKMLLCIQQLKLQSISFNTIVPVHQPLSTPQCSSRTGDWENGVEFCGVLYALFTRLFYHGGKYNFSVGAELCELNVNWHVIILLLLCQFSVQH